jgi:hypothetical protein
MVGASQVKVVPFGTKPFVPFVGVTEKAIPEQKLLAIFVIEGTGFTKKVSVNGVEFPQVPNDGITV